MKVYRIEDAAAILAGVKCSDGAALPEYTLADMVENLRNLLFVYQLRALSGEERNITRAATTIKHLASALRDLSEIAEATTLKDMLKTSQTLIEWIALRYKNDEALPQMLAACQAFYDEKRAEFLRL